MYPSAGNVAVSIGRQVTAHVGGVHRCGSAWSCPICAPVVRERRAREIESAAVQHLAAGGGLLLLTLTIRHARHDALGPRLRLLATSAHDLLKGAGWTRRQRRLGWVGAIKSLEITYGGNGWHPHAHVLLFLDRPLSAGDLDDLRTFLHGRWAGIVERAGFGTINRKHGVDLRVVDNGDALGDYLTKVEAKGRRWTVGQELARADLKRGRVDSLVPFELLADFCATGDVASATLWQEYEAATFGKQAVRWSDGLKDRFGVRKIDDVEAAAAEGEDVETYFRWLIEAALWRRILRERRAGQVLDDLEDEAARRFALAAAVGIDLEPLEDGHATDLLVDAPP